MNSSVTLNYKKNYFKDIKEVCNENLVEYKKVKIVRVIRNTLKIMGLEENC